MLLGRNLCFDKVDDGEDDDPYQVDKVPVEADNLDPVLIPATVTYAYIDKEEVYHPAENMSAVEGCHYEEGGAEECAPF